MEPSAKGEHPGQISEATGDSDSRPRPPNANSPGNSRRKDHMVGDAIGKALQAHYRALTDAPLPDRFRVLLAQLESKDSHDDE
jgi:hypothetical protein